MKLGVEIVENPFVFKKDFGISRGGRAHVARMVLLGRDSCKKFILDQRMCTYYLSGIVSLASARRSSKEFNASAKVARKAPFDRNVENQWFFNVPVKGSWRATFALALNSVNDIRALARDTIPDK